MKPERQDSWVKGASTAATVSDSRMGSRLEHCRVEGDGSVMVRNGTIRCTSATIAAATAYGLRMFRDAGGTRRFVALLGAAAYKAATTAAGPWTSLATGLTADYADFTEFRYGSSTYLLWANGTDVRAYDGTTVTTPAGVPANMRFIRAFNDRVWIAGTDNKLYACKIRDFTVWTVPDGIALQIGGSRPITGIEVAGAHLLVFKSEETERVTGFGEATLMVAQGATGVSQSVGCVNFRTIQACGDNGVAWLSHRGIEFYAPAAGYAKCVSGALDAFFHPTPASVSTYPYSANADCFAFAPYATAHSYYDTRRGEYHLFIRDNLDAQAEVVFVPATGACYLWPFNQTPSSSAAAAYVYTAPPVAGDADFYPLSIDAGGYPLLREYGTSDVQTSDGSAGFALTGTVRSRTFDFGAPLREKRGRVLRVLLRNITAGALTADIRGYSEASAVNSHTITVPLQASKYGVARISVRGQSLYGEVTLKPGVALDGMEMDAEIFVRGVR